MNDSMTRPGVAGWIQYAGPDTAAAKQFYRDVIGWTITDMPMQDGSSYAGIMVDDSPIGGFSPYNEEVGNWTAFITVDDVDSCVVRATQAGGTVLSGPMNAPGVGRIVTLRDPQGARIALITYECMQN